MTSYDEALEKILSRVKPAPAVTLPVGEALGAGTATAVSSRLDVPDFDNAAMDGVAVRAADIEAASAASPVELAITGVVPAGYKTDRSLGQGEAMEIMTGAPMPPGADTVVPIERLEYSTTPDGERIARVQFAAECGRNVRRAGEDFRRAEELLRAGADLGPEAVMNLAAAGVDEILATTPPAVAVITTGSELASAGTPSGTGQIRDSNGPYLAAGLPLMGGRLVQRTTAGDTTEAITDAIGKAPGDARVLLTTGGVSAGRYDCVPAAVNAVGGEILFHKVAIRPGKPILFAALPDDRWLFGLPGNPVAVAVGLRFFVAPALRALRGLAPEQRLPAISTTDIRKRPGLRFFGKAVASVSAAGQLQVELLPGQESFRVRPLIDANCRAIVDEARERVAPGELIEVAPLHPTCFLQPA
jgi:molybdopterin molybdotransferase